MHCGSWAAFLRNNRKDRMSAAVNNLCDAKEFTRAYEGLLRHYRIGGQKIQAGQANENGDVEQRHYRFKQAADQALMMRGSRDSPGVAAYQMFLDKLFTRLNAGRRERYLEEAEQLRPLPEQRLDSVRRERVRVSPGSLVTVHRNCYSVHSRLIGEMVEARIRPDMVEIWYSDRKVEELPRLRGRSKHRIDYRHIIDWLVRKPGALKLSLSERLVSDQLVSSGFRCFARGTGSQTGRPRVPGAFVLGGPPWRRPGRRSAAAFVGEPAHSQRSGNGSIYRGQCTSSTDHHCY